MSLESLPPIAAPTVAPLTSDNAGIDLVVVLAVSRMDWHLAIKWLRLASLFSRQATHTRDRPLIVVMSPALTREEVVVLERAANGFAGEVSFYTCSGLNEIGYFGSPNQMFKAALDLTAQSYPGKAMLWCEADTVPMHNQWVESIHREYQSCGKPFMGDVHLCQRDHLTGNAVYHPDWKKFAPSLALLPGPDITMGWDSQCADDTLPRAHIAKTIQQIWRPEKVDSTFLATKIRPETALFHQDKSGHLIDLICDREKWLRFGNYEQLAKSTYDQAAFLNPVQAWGSDKPRMEILIVTHWRDIEYLRYLVRSIQRFCTGFAGVTIAVPTTENDGRYKWVPAGIRVHYYDETPGKGMLHHMAMKCSADVICPGADFILHLDPDCMFLTDTNPGDFLVDGKPILFREKYATLKNTNRQYWRNTVMSATGINAEWETMVRHPAVHAAVTYQKMRTLVQQHTGKPFDQYVLEGQNQFPQSFCEFNTLGAVAIQFFPEAYHFVDYNRDLDGLETGTNPMEGNWQYIYRMGRDKIVEFYSLHDVRKYWPDMDAILLRKPKLFYVK